MLVIHFVYKKKVGKKKKRKTEREGESGRGILKG
jgi:hypothetical protein